MKIPWLSFGLDLNAFQPYYSLEDWVKANFPLLQPYQQWQQDLIVKLMDYFDVFISMFGMVDFLQNSMEFNCFDMDFVNNYKNLLQQIKNSSTGRRIQRQKEFSPWTLPYKTSNWTTYYALIFQQIQKLDLFVNNSQEWNSIFDTGADILNGIVQILGKFIDTNKCEIRLNRRLNVEKYNIDHLPPVLKQQFTVDYTLENLLKSKYKRLAIILTEFHQNQNLNNLLPVNSLKKYIQDRQYVKNLQQLISVSGGTDSFIEINNDLIYLFNVWRQLEK